MQLNAYLLFNGQCEEAFRFYEQCFGGKITVMVPYTKMPAAGSWPPGWGNKILHASLVIGNRVLMASDALPELYKEPQGFSLSMEVETLTEAERVFEALAENGEVTMPLAKTFWAARFGMLIDRFGIPWQVNCEKE